MADWYEAGAETGAEHDALSFSGEPLLHVPVRTAPDNEDGAPPRTSGSTPPARGGAEDPAGLAERMALSLQRAHASVLDAHHAISLWQTRNVARRDTVAAPAPASDDVPAPASNAPRLRLPASRTGLENDDSPPSAETAATPAPPPHSGLGAVRSLLSTACAALPHATGDAPPTGRRRYEMTWHAPVTTAPSDLRTLSLPVAGTGARACRVDDGDRPLLTFTEATSDRVPTGTQGSATAHPPDPRPLARTSVTRLLAADLDTMVTGRVAAVLGDDYDQSHLPPALRLQPWRDRLLEGVEHIDPTGGAHGLGALTATLRPAGDGATPSQVPYLVSAAAEALYVYALHRGLHLCLPAAHPVPLPEASTHIEVYDTDAVHSTPTQLSAVVVRTGMSPRPFVTADCLITANDERVVARLSGLSLAVYGEPREDALLHVKRTPCRLASTGEPAPLNELHMAHIAEGDLGQVLAGGGAPPARTAVRPRLPRGDLLMVDRGLRLEKGDVAGGIGASAATEYDMPTEPWYHREAGTDGVPPLALMEMALQPTGLLAGALGLATQYPDEPFVCRNLEGRARLTHLVDPRGTTVGQQVRLRSATDLPGAVMHTYAFELSSDGLPFYVGETVHGYFTADVLARQQGLDHGQYRAPWLDLQDTTPPGTHHFDAREDARLGRGRMALLEETTVVPAGGAHGKGYALCAKPVRADDWFFDRHFLHDPVMPGSAGVQMLYQAVQAFALHTGLTGHLPHAWFRAAVGEELHWSYRGQILREHQRVRGEVHLREVRREPDHVFLRADGSVWRDDLRIYHIRNIALVAASPASPAFTEVGP
ncbi:3-hydroxyacyl-ACP dehydratase [Streptomyces sp. NPDC093546]|uniref:3-hydroxyacyl-ACP dehydratase n=1 Tax=Streptomyces sp. NPDC093546 TaxID=3366040 RepID=UPI00381A6222